MGSNPDWEMDFFSFFAEFSNCAPPLVAKIYPIDIVKRFSTQRLGLNTVIFEIQLLSTTDMVHLSWKFHLTLVLTILMSWIECIWYHGPINSKPPKMFTVHQ